MFSDFSGYGVLATDEIRYSQDPEHPRMYPRINEIPMSPVVLIATNPHTYGRAFRREDERVARIVEAVLVARDVDFKDFPLPEAIKAVRARLIGW